MVERYIFSGSLPEDATTYVTREADTQLYEGLKAGRFCYVLNSRQTGKSSLRVRTMRRLREEDFSCVAIDLSFGGIQYVTPEQWYVDLIDTLIDSLALDVDLEEWWLQHKLLSPLKRFRKLIEEVLLVEVAENIIIFIDEIDSVLSLNFPTDDFFAFIRACYNQRADNPKYRRLSFCLLGVASPSELIADKKRTPFNIGQAIFLKGFQWEEVEPLKKGLQSKVGDLTTVMKEILEWTGGQPFLTQKLCQFVVEESDRDQPRSVEEIVRARIIANWESNDEPEHLKTIRDRILRDDKRAGYLLELYQQILQQKEIPLNDSLEQSELQLSGLVIKRQGKLQVNNPIYREVFNQNWLDEQLASLRPYSENFRAWVASGGEDESRLLQGQALQDAEEWATYKNLTFQDKEFLAASKNLAIEEENKKAQLERERQDKEAELERERQAREVAEEANRKAQRRIRIGSIVLSITLLGAGISAVWGSIKFQDALKAQKEAEVAIGQKKEAEMQFKEVQDQLDKANKDVEEADQRVKEAQEQEIQAKKQTEAAEKQKQEAEKKAEQAEQAFQSAQQALEQAKTERGKLEQEVQKLAKIAEKAERKAQEAQQLEKKANQELKKAQQAKTEAEKAFAKTNQALEAVRGLSVLAGELRRDGAVEESDEALRKAGLSTLIANEELKQTFLLAATAEAYQSLGDVEQAKGTLEELRLASLNINESQLDPEILNQVRAFAYFQAGKVKGEKYFQNAYDALKASNFDPFNPNIETDVLNEQDVENIHWELIKSKNIDINSETDPIAKDFREHLYAGLKFLLQEDRLREADQKTFEVMLYIAETKEEGSFTVESLANFDCEALREIDSLWLDYPEPGTGHFGFSVQKEIWQKNGSPTVDSPIEMWRKFYIEVGWKTEESGIESDGYLSYDRLGGFTDKLTSKRGNLPVGKLQWLWPTPMPPLSTVPAARRGRIAGAGGVGAVWYLSLAANCNL